MTHFTHLARIHAAAALIGAIAVSGLIAPAQASGQADAKQAARQVCQSVIRVEPGESHFDGCASSLTVSLESASRVHAMAQARNGCFVQGLKPGSADLNLCLLRAADTKPNSDAFELSDTASITAGITDDPQSSKSYFAVSPEAKFHREQKACAVLGFDPAFGAFANCVADLQGTLQAIDMPED